MRPPSRKALALIAYLALEGPQPRERAADLLWTQAGARRNLRQELFLIGRSALAGALHVTASHLALTDGVAVDALDLVRGARDGDLTRALAAGTGALLDGHALEDAPAFEGWLGAWRARLAELGREVRARRAAQLETDGDLRGALALHLEVLALDPLQEAHEREAIRLHARLGERERALERYARFHALLAEDLGLEPLPETRQEADLAARGAAPVAAPPVPAAQPSPALQPPLIGRQDVWRALEGSPTGLTLLHGEPGVGKTRLTLAFAATLGVPVVVQGREVAQGTPLYPVAEALRAALREPRAKARLDALDEVWRVEVGRLVPEFAPPGSGPENRARFVEALTRALLAAAGPGGALVWDDLHWMDGATLEVLAHLVRRPPEGDAPRALATARTDELRELPGGPALREALRREGRLVEVALPGLAEGEVRDLVEALSGTAAERFSRRLHAATGGNPLFVLETLRALFERGELTRDAAGWRSVVDETTEDYAELTIAPGVREAIASRVERLGAAARRLLEAASVCADDFTLADLSSALALSEWEAVDALEQLTGASLLEGRAGAYRFPHSLLRRTVASGLGAERRRLLHRRLAATLGARGDDPARVAEHLDQAGEVSEAAAWHARAAVAAARVFAYREALQHYDRALSAVSEPVRAFAWRLARVDLLRILDDRAALRAEVAALAAVAERLGEAERAQAALRRAAVHDQAGERPEALAAAREAAAARGLPTPLRAEALKWLGVAHQRRRDFVAAEAHFREGLALPDVPPATEAGLHDGLTYCLIEQGERAAARDHNRRALALFTRAADLRGQAIARNTAARLAMLDGDFAGAATHLRAALEGAREAGDVKLVKAFLTNLVHVLSDDGHLDEAIDALQEGLDLVRAGDDRAGEGRLEERLGDLQWLRGRLGAALAAYGRAAQIAEELGDRASAFHSCLADVRARLALHDLAPAARALDDLDALAAEEDAGAGALQVALERAWLAWRAGRTAEAAWRLEALQGAHDRFSPLARERLALLRAHTALAGRPGEAADLSRTLGVTPTLRAAALSVLLTATPDDQAARVEATALLASGRAAPLAALDLRRALARSGPEGARRAHTAEADALLGRLAASLDDALRSTFLAGYAAPLEEPR